jgi:anti-anti-sigma factor
VVVGFSVESVAPAHFLLTGELDIYTAPTLERTVAEAAGESDQLILDLAQLEFMDSSGLKLLIRLARAHAGGVELRNPQPPVKRALWMTGFGDRPNVGIRIVDDAAREPGAGEGSDFLQPG